MIRYLKILSLLFMINMMMSQILWAWFFLLNPSQRGWDLRQPTQVSDTSRDFLFYWEKKFSPTLSGSGRAETYLTPIINFMNLKGWAEISLVQIIKRVDSVIPQCVANNRPNPSLSGMGTVRQAVFSGGKKKIPP